MYFHKMTFCIIFIMQNLKYYHYFLSEKQYAKVKDRETKK